MEKDHKKARDVLEVSKIIRFPVPYRYNSPKDAGKTMNALYGPDAKNFHGVTALITGNYHLAPCEKRGCTEKQHPRMNAIGLIEFHNADIAYPEMIPICKSHFPEMHNAAWIIERGPEPCPEDKVLGPDRFERLMNLWIAYAESIGMAVKKGGELTMKYGPASSFAFDFQVLFREGEDYCPTTGIHCYGMECFIPFDPNERILRLDDDDPIKVFLGKVKAALSEGKIAEITDLDGLEEIPDLSELTGHRKGKKGGTFH